MSEKTKKIQMVWGIALVFMGLIVLINIPQKMALLESRYSSDLTFLRICFYLISLFLITGGGKKLFNYFSKS